MRFTEGLRRPVISRGSAENLGDLTHFMIDPPSHRVCAIVIGTGPHALMANWTDVGRFGPDAVMISDQAELRQPTTMQDKAVANGSLELIGKQALGTDGNVLGTVMDAEFDPDSAVLQQLIIGDDHVPATRLLAIGPYAAVISVDQT